MQTEYLAKNLLEITDKIAQHGIAIIDQLLPAPTVDALAEEISQLAKFNTLKAAGTGRENVAINANLRGDHIYWLDEQSSSPAQQDYFNTMEALRLEINRQLYLGLFGLESHLALYPTGMAYQKHIDRFKGENLGTPLRQISAILYLNSQWQESNGGHLRLYLQEESPARASSYIDILPTAGKAVFFLSDTFYHEVLPANQDRMSVTGWFLTR
jgi:SM-20-related protein